MYKQQTPIPMITLTSAAKTEHLKISKIFKTICLFKSVQILTEFMVRFFHFRSRKITLISAAELSGHDQPPCQVRGL